MSKLKVLIIFSKSSKDALNDFLAKEQIKFKEILDKETGKVVSTDKQENVATLTLEAPTDRQANRLRRWFKYYYRECSTKAHPEHRIRAAPKKKKKKKKAKKVKLKEKKKKKLKSKRAVKSRSKKRTSAYSKGLLKPAIKPKEKLAKYAKAPDLRGSYSICTKFNPINDRLSPTCKNCTIYLSGFCKRRIDREKLKVELSEKRVKPEELIQRDPTNKNYFIINGKHALFNIHRTELLEMLAQIKFKDPVLKEKIIMIISGRPKELEQIDKLTYKIINAAKKTKKEKKIKTSTIIPKKIAKQFTAKEWNMIAIEIRNHAVFEFGASDPPIPSQFSIIKLKPKTITASSYIPKSKIKKSKKRNIKR